MITAVSCIVESKRDDTFGWAQFVIFLILWSATEIFRFSGGTACRKPRTPLIRLSVCPSVRLSQKQRSAGSAERTSIKILPYVFNFLVYLINRNYDNYLLHVVKPPCTVYASRSPQLAVEYTTQKCDFARTLRLRNCSSFAVLGARNCQRNFFLSSNDIIDIHYHEAPCTYSDVTGDI